ncbi:class I SAM-dependent methyltransferase, partial [Candidatus Woesearchaeota archaeon]|nr:class I SAM-dependent methyltransferase [Candidatus Woesearchaeota archaeon]
MKLIEKCEVCGKNKFSFLFYNRDRIYCKPGRFKQVKCINCGLVFINPQPSLEKLEKYYPANYYSYNTTAIKNEIKSKISSFLYETYYSKKGSIFMKILFLPMHTLLRETAIIPNGKILDVGSGSGEFLIKMKEFGMECFGVDPGKIDKVFAEQNKLNIKQGILLEAKYPDNFFDVITLNHVFEHL